MLIYKKFEIFTIIMPKNVGKIQIKPGKNNAEKMAGRLLISTNLNAGCLSGLAMGKLIRQIVCLFELSASLFGLGASGPCSFVWPIPHHFYFLAFSNYFFCFHFAYLAHWPILNPGNNQVFMNSFH